ncbi:MAG: carboxypeptidase-like regulatory domain-containing protein [Candidatus Acidiferrales bacterium]
MVRSVLARVTLVMVAAAMPALAMNTGTLSGTVVDPAGVPQMGASVAIVNEGARASAEPRRLLSNVRGVFSAERLLPGMYSVRVTLAGFLPAVERHIRIEPNLVTMLKIELGSVFSSLDQLRRKPGQETDPDEWAWVLRSSSAHRSVLRFADGEAVSGGQRTAAERMARMRPAARFELTAGARRPGSVSNLADAPASAVAYEQSLGMGRLLFAGQMSYERSASAGIATMWLPFGELGRGPETTVVMRQAQLGPGREPFRGVRMEHNNQMTIGDRLLVRYGAEYFLISLGESASSVRPQGEVAYQISPEWKASFAVASRPWAHAHGGSDALQSTLEEMDAFPTLLVRDGRPVLEGGWHEEIAVERRVGEDIRIVAAIFNERARHTAVMGRGDLQGNDVFQDFYSNAFAYDGGASGGTGSRLAYRQRLAEDAEVVLVYAWAPALSSEELADAEDLRGGFRNQNHHSFAARASTRLPKLGTRVAASYKWVDGPIVSRLDAYGETTYQIDPFLNVTLRQPLPGTLFSVRWEALADFRNLMAQGYVPVRTGEGQVLLIPAFRSFRGGFSFQF